MREMIVISLEILRYIYRERERDKERERKKKREIAREID